MEINEQKQEKRVYEMSTPYSMNSRFLGIFKVDLLEFPEENRHCRPQIRIQREKLC